MNMAEKNPEDIIPDEKEINGTEFPGSTASDRKTTVPTSDESVIHSTAGVTHCDLCCADGDLVEAYGYCFQCHEYYCQACYKAHAKSKATKQHDLLDKSKMPSTSTSAVLSSIASDSYDVECQDKFHFFRDVNIKHYKDRGDCYITGMVVVSDNSIVIVDKDNKSLKMINVVDDSICGYIGFEHKPFGITVMPNAKVAVAFPGEKLIRILTTSGEFCVTRTLNVNGLCTAVQYCNDTLYVSYQNEMKFQCLGLNGAVRKTIVPNAYFLKHYKLPYYIHVNPDERSMYVSDWKNHVVFSIDMNGSMLAAYKDGDLEQPHDITDTPFDSIYLCNTGQHIVYKLTDDLNEATVVLSAKDGLYYPTAMCFVPARKYLYISSGGDIKESSNSLKLFRYS